MICISYHTTCTCCLFGWKGQISVKEGVKNWECLRKRLQVLLIEWMGQIGFYT